MAHFCRTRRSRLRDCLIGLRFRLLSRLLQRLSLLLHLLDRPLQLLELLVFLLDLRLLLTFHLSRLPIHIHPVRLLTLLLLLLLLYP
jgi:hypothetical protein